MTTLEEKIKNNNYRIKQLESAIASKTKQLETALKTKAKLNGEIAVDCDMSKKLTDVLNIQNKYSSNQMIKQVSSISFLINQYVNNNNISCAESYAKQYLNLNQKHLKYSPNSSFYTTFTESYFSIYAPRSVFGKNVYFSKKPSKGPDKYTFITKLFLQENINYNIVSRGVTPFNAEYVYIHNYRQTLNDLISLGVDEKIANTFEKKIKQECISIIKRDPENIILPQSYNFDVFSAAKCLM